MLLIYCLMYFPLFVGVLCLSLFCYALLYVRSNFAIILKWKRELVALLLLSYRCIVIVRPVNRDGACQTERCHTLSNKTSQQ